MYITFTELLDTFPAITGVVHVGANDCQEAAQYACRDPARKVFWVEALDAYVQKHAATKHIAQAVISDEDGIDVVFNITNNMGLSSSILELGTHLQEHPQVQIAERMHAKTMRLDTLLSREGIDGTYNFLNLDIQGAELKALQGLGTRIDHFDYVYSEINEAYLYKNCALFHELDAYLHERGFEVKFKTVNRHMWGEALWVRQGILQTKSLQCSSPP